MKKYILFVGSWIALCRTFSRSEAITKYSLVAAGIESCLLELNLLTGKKHQARVHCSEGLGRLFYYKLFSGFLMKFWFFLYFMMRFSSSFSK